MTAPTDHLAAAVTALSDARGTGPGAALHLARAQVYATIALAEETHTTNLLRALDYWGGPAEMHSRDRLDEITARLWATS